MRRNWTREELLVALKIYCELEFGQFHSRQQHIIEVAEKIGRTPSSLAMKLCNFASLDPAMQGKGLKGASKADAEIVGQYLESPEKLILDSEFAWERLVAGKEYTSLEEEDSTFEYEITEKISNVKTRTVQSFFRVTVLSSYHRKCAVCALDIQDLLIASHIIPWSHNTKMRANPKNGISLCNLHDKAFDKGFITINSDYKVIIGKKIQSHHNVQIIRDGFIKYSETEIHLPFRFMPAQECLEYHQDSIFLG